MRFSQSNFPLNTDLTTWISQGSSQLINRPIVIWQENFWKSLLGIRGDYMTHASWRTAHFTSPISTSHRDYIIIGDGGHPCLDKTSLPHHTLQRAREWLHGGGASISTMPVGAVLLREKVLKTWWRSFLFRASDIRPKFSKVVIATCACLHNVCLDNGDMLEPDNVTQDIFDPQPQCEAMVQMKHLVMLKLTNWLP